MDRRSVAWQVLSNLVDIGEISTSTLGDSDRSDIAMDAIGEAIAAGHESGRLAGLEEAAKLASSRAETARRNRRLNPAIALDASAVAIRALAEKEPT